MEVFTNASSVTDKTLALIWNGEIYRYCPELLKKKKVKVSYLYGLLFYLERLKMSLVWLSEMRNSGINKV